jgi:hypothetical protein
MKYYIWGLAYLLLMITTISCLAQTPQAKKDTASVKPEVPFPDFAEKFNISLIKLIANLEKYHGKTMQIRGFINLEYEGNAIYLHREDFEHGLSDNAIWVDTSGEFLKTKKLSEYHRKYVIMQGTFDMTRQGHMGMFG